MSKAARIVLIVIVAGSLLLATGIGATAAAVYHSGTISVDVREQGDRFRIAVPAALVRVGVHLVPDAVLDDALRDVLVEVGPILPAVEAAWRELARTPDFVLVEVTGPRERVRIAKEGNLLVIHVEDGSSDVHVSLPMSTIGSLMARLDRVGRRS